MLRTLFLVTVLTSSSVAFCVEPQQKKDDPTVHHAAMHAEHWVDHHVSAPHGKNAKHRQAVIHKKVKSVHHAAMHAEHWIDHHVSAPHKTGGN